MCQIGTPRIEKSFNSYYFQLMGRYFAQSYFMCQGEVFAISEQNKYFDIEKLCVFAHFLKLKS